MDACRFFGGTPEMWEDELTMNLLAAQQRSILRRPPPEFFLAGYFGYEGTSRADAAEMELPEALPLFEP